MSLKSRINEYGIAPKHHRGQNFLIDGNVLKKIVSVANVTKKTTVVEIGAGLGFLTKMLAEKVKKVFAIELDKELAEILKKECALYSNIKIIQDDAREVETNRFGKKNGDYTVVANIPYNITSIIIQKFLKAKVAPSRLVLLIQKEVGERICARPPHMNLLALSVQQCARPQILFSVSKNCFFPKPKVDSVVIDIELFTHAQKNEKEKEFFFSCIKAGFLQKRKFLLSNLHKGLTVSRDELEKIFCEFSIPFTARAQELSLAQWEKLVSQLKIINYEL